MFVAGAHAAGGLWGPAIMHWAAGEQLQGLQALLRAGGSGVSTGPNNTTECSGSGDANSHTGAPRESGLLAGDEYELLIDFLRQSSSAPDVRLWKGELQLRPHRDSARILGHTDELQVQLRLQLLVSCHSLIIPPSCNNLWVSTFWCSFNSFSLVLTRILFRRP